MTMCAIFSTCRNSLSTLCFIRTSMSDTILLDCQTLCCHLSRGSKTKWNIVGKVWPLLPYRTANICLWHLEPTSSKRMHYSWSQPHILHKLCSTIDDFRSLLIQPFEIHLQHSEQYFLSWHWLLETGNLKYDIMQMYPYLGTEVSYHI